MNRAIPFAFLFAAAACAQKIDIAPSSVLIDQPSTIRVTGLLPNAPITLKADLVDGAGHPWNAEAQFTADAHGTVDLAQQAPTAGSYRTVSAMGLIWAMRPASKDTHFYAPPHDPDPEIVHFHLLVDGREAANADLVQSLIADGVQRVHLQGALHGTLFLPPGDGRHPGVLVLGGSEGGVPAARAAWLASHGYAALALAYFRFESLPPTLRDIPLEYFGQALSWMSQRPEIDPNRLAVMGASRGGELSLQLASIYPQIHAVVAFVPANVRHPSCCDRPMGAAWTLHGQPLAWSLPEVRSDPAAVMRSTIAVENIRGPVLMIGAESDGVWPSSDMVQAAADRFRQTHFAYPVVTLIYPHAGHRAGMPEIVPAWNNGIRHPLTGSIVNLGGTPEGNAASTLDAIPKILAFLSQSLGVAPSQPVTQVSSPAAPTP